MTTINARQKRGGKRLMRVHGKGRRVRTLGVPDDVYAAVQGWLDAYETATGISLRAGDPMFLPLDSAAMKEMTDGSK